MGSDVTYAKSGDVHIAYRVFGDGPRDLVLIPGTLSHVELFWELPINQYLLKRLTSFARVIVFDKRGQGLSDRVAEQTLEERIGDVRAVMDAAGSRRATIFGWSEGGSMSLMFSATYPERTIGPRAVRQLRVHQGGAVVGEPGAVGAIPRPGRERTGVRASSFPSTRRAVETTRRSSSGSAGWSAPRPAPAPSWR